MHINLIKHDLVYCFSKNYNLAPQIISYFMDSLLNYQQLDYSSQTIKMFEKAFWPSMSIIPLSPVIFQLKNKF